jgi:hypothetical protein
MGCDETHFATDFAKQEVSFNLLRCFNNSFLPVNRAYAEVGNVTSKLNSVTRYRLSHALRAIAIKSDNVPTSAER